MVNAVLVVETLHATSLPPHLFVLFVLFVVPARTLPSESTRGEGVPEAPLPEWERGWGEGESAVEYPLSSRLCAKPLPYHPNTSFTIRVRVEAARPPAPLRL
jgi:hypothetical protein